jgi:hypothetical protein
MSGFPKDYKLTGKKFAGFQLATSEIIPNCRRCFVISGRHIRTSEMGWYAFCKKTGKLDNYGPYKSIYEALHYLILTKSCDTCEYNVSIDKGSMLQEIDKDLEDEIKAILGDDNILTKIDVHILKFFEYREYIDILFNNIFGVKFFNIVPDDSLAALELVKPCNDRSDFAIKIMILAGLLDRINPEVKKILKPTEKDLRSIQIMERILKEYKKDYETSIVSNFRNLINLRSKLYPAHVTESEIIKILNNFGIVRYPPDNWETMFIHIFDLVSNSLILLYKEFQEIKTSKPK